MPPLKRRNATISLAFVVLVTTTIGLLYVLGFTALLHSSCSPQLVLENKSNVLSFLDSSSLSLSSSSSLQAPPSSSSTTGMFSYSAALFTLKCLTTAGCFRSLSCRTGVPQKVPRRKKWEEQSFCVDDLKKDANDCLVYSFGIYNSVEWEQKMAKLFGCQVHAFDPTMNHKRNIAPGVTFHKLGLQAAGTNMSATHSDEYDAIDPSKLLTLDKIMEQLGHTNRTLNVLMLDCEGCEWGVLKEMMCNGDGGAMVDQIVVEMHFQKNLGMMNEADVMIAAEAVMCLEQSRWGIVSIESSGIAKEDAVYAKDVAKVLHGETGGFLLNIALQRIPETDPLPSERLEAISALSIPVDRERIKCTKTYGNKMKEWPGKACPEFRKLNRKYNKAIEAYNKITKKRAFFENKENPRINETTWEIPEAKN